MNVREEGRVKFTIERLGRIKRAELDIRPLTVLIGPNNTNKTWTAYLLYGHLQMFSRKLSNISYKFAHDDKHGPTVRRTERLREALRPLLNSLTDPAAPSRTELSLDASSLFLAEEQSMRMEARGEPLRRLLGVSPELFADASARLDFSRTEFATSIASMDLSFEHSLKRLQIKTNRRWLAQDGQSKQASTLVSLVSDEWTEQRILNVMAEQISSLIENVVVFPAERNGLLPVWPLIQVHESNRLELPLAVMEFGRFLAVAQTTAPMVSLNAVQHHLAQLLKKVMGGEIIYVADLEAKRLVFRSGTAEVPIHAAASVVRAVAGLALYVERFFQPDDVLIVDELEMNAHPEAQLALTEFIAALVNAGVRVVFTTHSPYVVDHLNNLMEASRAPADRREELARRFSLETPSSFISPDKVSVYAFQEQSPGGEVMVQDVLDRKTNLINWSTFSRVSERITNLYGDILRTIEDEP